jgi:hypothetical protein
MPLIAPSGGKAPLGRAIVFWELPFGMHQARNGAVLRNNNKDNPKHPLPSEASVLSCFMGRCENLSEIISDIGS